ncbi:hypothetical protein THIX_60327 [Thiomonas sp. X19]|nr:hypothetical protein THIX_60327 [Thiomonas sp. X19]
MSRGRSANWRFAFAPTTRFRLPQEFWLTISENHPEPYAPSLPSYFVMAGSRNSVLPRLKPHPYFG